MSTKVVSWLRTNYQLAYMNPIFLALLLIPVIEIAVLISVGGVIGLPLTIVAVLLTAILGTFLLRQQGLSLLFSAQQDIANGQIPASKMVEGVVLAVGGALLLTPGFVTDAIGFMCLIPGSRHMIVAAVSRRFKSNAAVFSQSSHFEETRYTSEEDGVTLEGEYKKES